ncbi:DUF4139 domain-containing protein [Massilia sp. H-1]|nr:DUF4139 domain-containing protein [Massilia sp. H-1]
MRLSGDKGGTVTLIYQLNNAGWKPGYRASLDSGCVDHRAGTPGHRRPEHGRRLEQRQADAVDQPAAPVPGGARSPAVAAVVDPPGAAGLRPSPVCSQAAPPWRLSWSGSR